MWINTFCKGVWLECYSLCQHIIMVCQTVHRSRLTNQGGWPPSKDPWWTRMVDPFKGSLLNQGGWNQDKVLDEFCLLNPWKGCIINQSGWLLSKDFDESGWLNPWIRCLLNLTGRNLDRVLDEAGLITSLNHQVRWPPTNVGWPFRMIGPLFDESGEMTP